MVLDSEVGMSVTCEAGDGVQSRSEALDNEVDLAVLDITMPGMGGLEAAREIAPQRPQFASSCFPSMTTSSTSTKQSAPAPTVTCASPPPTTTC